MMLMIRVEILAILILKMIMKKNKNKSLNMVSTQFKIKTLKLNPLTLIWKMRKIMLLLIRKPPII